MIASMVRRRRRSRRPVPGSVFVAITRLPYHLADLPDDSIAKLQVCQIGFLRGRAERGSEPMSGLADLEDETVGDFAHYWETVFNEGDYRAAAAYYTEDAHLIATQTETIEG